MPSGNGSRGSSPSPRRGQDRARARRPAARRSRERLPAEPAAAWRARAGPGVGRRFHPSVHRVPQGRAHDDDVDAFTQLIVRWQRPEPRAAASCGRGNPHLLTRKIADGVHATPGRPRRSGPVPRGAWGVGPALCGGAGRSGAEQAVGRGEPGTPARGRPAILGLNRPRVAPSPPLRPSGQSPTSLPRRREPMCGPRPTWLRVATPQRGMLQMTDQEPTPDTPPLTFDDLAKAH